MKTRQGWEQNTFLQNLINRVPFPFSPSDIEKIIVQYQLGTVLKGYMAGAVTFPFIDENNNVRAIQVKQFNESNHTISTTFLHSIIEQNLTESKSPLPAWLKLYNENESKVTCLFGAHLLKKYPYNPIALVEAPKTAIMGTLYYGFPEIPESLLWIAVYNKSSLSFEKCRALQGRKVVLFPDLNAYNDWNNKAIELKAKLPGTRFVVSDLLEQNATETEITSGLDLADYLARFDYKLFRKQQPGPWQEPKSTTRCEKSEKGESATKQFLPLLNNESSNSLYYQPEDIQTQLSKKPLRPATGRLKELEDTFIRITQQSKSKPSNREQIIRLFDKYKRVYPANSALNELDFLIQN